MYLACNLSRTGNVFTLYIALFVTTTVIPNSVNTEKPA